MSEKNLEKDIMLYDWDFVDPPPNEYICKHCNVVFVRPMIIECCGRGVLIRWNGTVEWNSGME